MHILKMRSVIIVAAVVFGFIVGFSAPRARSLIAQIKLAPILLAASTDPERGAFVVAPDDAAKLDAAGFTRIIVEPKGSGVAILSTTHYTGFYDLGMAKVGEGIVVSKTAKGWVAARDSRYADIGIPLSSLIAMLSEHRLRNLPST